MLPPDRHQKKEQALCLIFLLLFKKLEHKVVSRWIREV